MRQVRTKRKLEVIELIEVALELVDPRPDQFTDLVFELHRDHHDDGENQNVFGGALAFFFADKGAQNFSKMKIFHKRDSFLLRLHIGHPSQGLDPETHGERRNTPFPYFSDIRPF